jgi:tRNA(Ile)-lysidine synthase
VDDKDDFEQLFAVLDKHKKIALAVSGGSDSTALMVLAANWASDNARLEDIHVVTVNHQLRVNALQEAEQVCRWAQTLGLSATILQWQHDQPETAIQKKARQARYRLMGQWCTENGFAGVVTAHNRDDQAETLLMRLARGSGVDGLAAMAGQTVVEGTRVFRPLLAVSRARLQEVLQQANHGWINDPSNENDKFERVRVRAVLARLEQTGISRKSLALTARRAARASDGLEVMTDTAMAAAVVVFDTGHCQVDLCAFTALPEDIGIRVLGRLVDWAGGGEEYLKLAKLERLYHRLCDHRQDQYTLAGAQIVRRKAVIVIGREFGRVDPAICRGVRNWDKRFCFAESVDVAPYGLFIDDDDRPRSSDLPYFVACALPALCRNGVLMVVPHLDNLDNDGGESGKKRPKLKRLPKGVTNHAVLSR